MQTPCFSGQRQSGFTLIELVAVIIVMGILAVTVAPKFINRDTFDAYTYRAELIASLRLTQQRAMQNQRAGVCHQFLLSAFNGKAQAGIPDVDACGANPRFTQSAADNGDFTRVEVAERDYTTFDIEGSATGAITFDSMGRPGGDCKTTITIGFITQQVMGCKITVSSLDTVSLCIETEGYIHNLDEGQACPSR